jgi:hypothetical protein
MPKTTKTRMMMLGTFMEYLTAGFGNQNSTTADQLQSMSCVLQVSAAHSA